MRARLVGDTKRLARTAISAEAIEGAGLGRRSAQPPPSEISIIQLAPAGLKRPIARALLTRECHVMPERQQIAFEAPEIPAVAKRLERFRAIEQFSQIVPMAPRERLL